MKSKVHLLLFSTLLVAMAVAHAEPKIPDEYKTGDFFLGCQAYTFNKFSAFEAIEKTAEAGGKVIEFYPGQKLSKEEPKLFLHHDASDEVLAKVQKKLAEHKIKAVNYGVVPISKEEDKARKVFEFARKMGIRAITTESTEAIDTIEKLVKEFDIMVAYHNHPRQPKNPDYKVWDPIYILQLCEGRDPRIGACADTGHWQTSGINPVWAVRTLKGRVISSHLKDKKDFGSSHDVPYGTGVGEIGRVLDELKKQNFQGNISIEYEYNWDNNVPDVTKCVEFVRNHKTAAAPAK
jgi:sugar phosphate isomerase/epimerase